MAGATLFRPPPSLRWSVVGAGSITSWNYQSTRTRRPPSIVSMSQSHHQSNTKPAAFDGLRAVHTPAPTPVLGGFQSTTDAYCSRSSRGQNKNNARLIPKAQLDSFTSGFMNIVTLVRDAFRGSSGTQKSVGLLTRARFHSLVEQVMDIIALAVYEIQWLGELTFGSRNVLLSLISQYVSFFLMEQVYREAFSMLRFGGALKRCGTYLTKLAKEGKFDPVIGRQNQIEQVVQILSRRFKNNPCLIGDPGVGKTAIVEGLAQLIATGNVPATLRGKKVIAIDMTGLLDGTHYRGDFESRMKNLLNEVKRSGNVILFIDEIHTIIGAGSCEGSAADVADMFKPALARGELQCIGATTTNEYKKHIEKDPALERRFGPVKIPEPTVDQSIGILRGLRERYEKHHKVQYADEALIAAAELSHKYISARFLPDKAIDLIDQAGSLVSLRHAQRKPSKEVKYLEAELNRIVKEKDNAVQRERLIRAKLLRDLKTEFNRIIKEKEDAIHREDFKRAKELRDRELELNRIIEDFDGVVHRESIKWMKELLDRELELRSLIEKMEDDDDDVKNAGVSARSVVTEEDIRHIVSTWTGVPVQKITTDETNRLLNMEETLHRRVIGQHDAVTAISRAIRRARAGLNEPGRPIGSFVFAGPTGVGKTELAKALAAFYYGSEDAMVRLDMSEFMDKHTVCRLIGTPPGHREHAEGVQLTEAVRRRPHTLILFDEIEKAHPDVFNVMLEILDDGRLTDGKGRTVDFRNTLIIMTSNIGGSVVVHGAGMSYERIKDLIGEEMRLHFRPEFLNRLDETIVFKQLTKVEVKEIAGIMLSHVAARVKGKGIELQVTDTFKELVVEEGFDPSYGVRPLKRAILRLLEDTLADKMLAGEIKERDSVTVDVDLAGNVVLKQNNRLM